MNVTLNKPKVYVISMLFATLLCCSTVFATDFFDPGKHVPSVPGFGVLSSQAMHGADVFSGAFIHEYELEVPPGTNGLTPSISLSYNSQSSVSRPGLVGSSWSITSQYIERSVNGSAANTSDDWFTLYLGGGSHKLVYNASTGRYHARIEQHYKIENKSTSSNDEGVYWIVTTPDGVSYRFGYASDSEQLSASFDFVTRWYLDLVTDPYGNTITYSYDENPFTGDVGATYPSEIVYNTDGLRKIVFSYEDRSDLRLLYSNGHKQTMQKRLSDISVLYNTSLVRRYHLDYEEFTAVSLLSKITMYGSDNASALPSMSFTYFNNSGWDATNDAWNLNVEHVLVDNHGNDLGSRMTDINADGYVDYIKELDCGGENCSFVLLNNKSGWDDVSNSSWKAPVDIAQKDEQDYGGVRFVDVNSDGRTDIVKRRCPQAGGSCVHVYLNNGSGWNNTPEGSWHLDSRFLLYESYNEGVMSGELNGDGRTDFIKRESCTESDCSAVVLNSPDGWVEDTRWELDSGWAFAEDGTGTSSRLVDVNGDGLSDVSRRYHCTPPCSGWHQGTLLNTGDGWVENGDWTLSRNASFSILSGGKNHDAGVRFTDLNGDGLVDVIKRTTGAPTCTGTGLECSIVYLNTGHGWEEATSDWELPSSFSFSGQAASQNTRISDVNGDGLGDVIKVGNCSGSTCSDTYLNKGFRNYLLKSIKYEFGGTINVDYTNSISFENIGDDQESDLPLNIPVVLSIQTDNGFVDSRKVQGFHHYSYSGGKYFFSGPDSEFRGFAESIEISPEGDNTVRRFHQSTQLQGREFETREYAGSTTLLRNTSQEFSFVDKGGFYFVTTDSTTSKEYDGQSTPRVQRTTYTYDQFGNMLSESNEGDISITGDERYKTYTYDQNTSAWILGMQLSEVLKDSDNSTVLRRTNYTYNDKGSPLTMKHYIASGDATHTYIYDQYGNVLTYKDPRSYTTTYTYDGTGTYKTKEVNPLAHQSTYEYDKGFGKLTKETDSNGYATQTVYDIFGRVDKVILPGDSSQSPTTSYVYNYTGVTPEHVITTSKISSGLNTVVHQYFDGRENVVQKKTASTAGALTVDTMYDKQGRVNATSNAYKSTAVAYTDSNATAHYTTFFYDAIDRLITTTLPDGNTVLVEYDRGSTTTTDENGNELAVKKDTRGNIVVVTEHLGSAEYNTAYGYNAADELVNISDVNGEITQFTFDTLGRKVGLDDPNIGVWTYLYDRANNLVQQTDSRGTVITMTYDGLNRIKKRNSSSLDITYTYDQPIKGTLNKEEGENYTVSYAYDSRLRVSQKNLTTQGETFSTSYTYTSQDGVDKKTMDAGEVVDFAFNDRGFVDEVAGVVTSISYSATGQPTQRSYANGEQTTLQYFADTLRLKELKTGDHQEYDYTYDAKGNVLTVADAISSMTEYYTYDDLDRLVSAKKNNSSNVNYSTTYTLSSTNTLLSVDTLTGTTTYTYASGPLHAPSSIGDATGTPSLSITLVDPATDTNVTKDAFFDFTSQVCCEGASCGSVTVSLDPKQDGSEYTHYSEKHCSEGICTNKLYSTVRFGYEDNKWKPIEKLRSFKTTVPIDCKVENDDVHEVECVDYNYTHRKLSVRVVDEAVRKKPIPIRKLRPVLQDDKLKWEERLEKREHLLLRNARKPQTLIVEAEYKDEVHVGAQSSTIKYVPNNASSFNGWWESTGGTLAMYGWSDCDANAYSTGNKNSISTNTTASSIYGSGGGTSTQFSYCHRMKWEITDTPEDVTSISSYAHWTGSPHAGSDSITKALYIGNEQTSKWEPLHTQTNAWSAVEHDGSVNTNIQDYIEEDAGDNYVYTLLHYNATRSSSSNNAYSNFYYTELRIITNESGGGSSSEKGLVNTTIGAVPFYTIDDNPEIITLTAGQCTNVTWSVNATGSVGGTHEFFAFANKTSDMSINDETAHINITIVAGQSGGSGPELVHHHTFASDDEGWGGGTHSTSHDGYYEETNSWSGIYSGDLSLTDYNSYRIEMIVWSKDSNYAKFYPNSQQYSGTGPHFYYERNGGDFNIKLYNGTYHPIASDAPKDENITWIVDVNRTSECINASIVWDGDSATLSSTCGANVGDKYLHWNGGDSGSGGYLRVMEVKVYDLG